MSDDRYRISVSYDSNKHGWGILDDPADVIAGVASAGGGTLPYEERKMLLNDSKKMEGSA